MPFNDFSRFPWHELDTFAIADPNPVTGGMPMLIVFLNSVIGWRDEFIFRPGSFEITLGPVVQPSYHFLSGIFPNPVINPLSPAFACKAESVYFSEAPAYMLSRLVVSNFFYDPMNCSP